MQKIVGSYITENMLIWIVLEWFHIIQILRSRFYLCLGMALDVLPPSHVMVDGPVASFGCLSHNFKTRKKSVLSGLPLKKTMFIFTTIL